LITRDDRIQIWGSQLAANDFPPVCAMSGRPAEIWKRFKFATPPQWAYALLVLICLGGIGLIIYAVVVSAVSQRASGFLPLTRSSRRTADLATWVPVSLLIAWAALWGVAAVIALSTTDDSLGTLAGVCFWIGLLLMIAGLVGRLVITRLVIPQAKVMEPQPGYLDKLVELRNVHPNFVQALHQQQVTRLAQTTTSP